MAGFGDRISERLKALDLSQAELARRVGITQPAINHLIKRGSGGSAHLYKIARELQTTPEYLVGETDDPTPDGNGGHALAYPSERADLVDVAEIDLRFGLGGAYMDEPAVPVMRSFSRAWLRNFTDSPPEELYWARGQGNSMETTIHENDLLLIDRRQQSPHMLDLIWAFAWGDIGAIKRLRPMPDGTVKILSDNPAVPPETAVEGDIHVFGRVVAVVKRV